METKIPKNDNNSNDLFKVLILVAIVGGIAVFALPQFQIVKNIREVPSLPVEPVQTFLRECKPNLPCTLKPQGNATLAQAIAFNSAVPATEPIEPGPDTKVLEKRTVYYGTNRTFDPQKPKEEMYSNELDKELTHFGKVLVTIPLFHEIGKLERPTIFETEDPAKYVFMWQPQSLEQTNFFNEMRLRALEPGGKDLLLYIHGFATTFPQAAQQTGQISSDLKFLGITVFFSWASQGWLSKKAYEIDEETIKHSIAPLKKFLVSLLQVGEVDRVILLAHSLGTRLLVDAAIDVIRELKEGGKKIQEIVLAAPDIDRMIFENEKAKPLSRGNAIVTLYASNKDAALKLSGEHHKFVRLGDVGKEISISPPMESIDATNAKTHFWDLGHSYHSNNRSILQDMHNLVVYKKRAKERTFDLSLIQGKLGEYWEYRK